MDDTKVCESANASVMLKSGVWMNFEFEGQKVQTLSHHDLHTLTALILHILKHLKSSHCLINGDCSLFFASFQKMLHKYRTVDSSLKYFGTVIF